MSSSDIDTHHLPRRLLSLVISVLVSLASGTPYLYGIYAPQLVKRVGLTTSDSATISLATNIGAGLGGLPAGSIIDHHGPQASILVGSISILTGYFGIFKLYQHEVGSLPLICVAMILMGFGSIICYFSTIKTAQANFPKHRGAAGAFPVSAYGLSATVFSMVTTAFFRDNTGGLLKFLSIFCGSVTFLGSFFIHIYLEHDDEEGDNSHSIKKVADEETSLMSRTSSTISSNYNEEDIISIPQSQSKKDRESQVTSYFRGRADSLRGSFSFWGIGTRTPRSSVSSISSEVAPIIQSLRDQNQSSSQSQKNPFLSRNNSSCSIAQSSSLSSNMKKVQSVKTKTKKTKNPIEIIRTLVTDKVFLCHYLLVSLASGIGQMYIYSVGFVVTAQYNYDKNHTNGEYFHSLIKSEPSAASLQALQVSIISIASFSGRLIAGILSDFIYKRYHIQRLWIVLVTVIFLATGQFISIVNVNNANLISLTSSIIGGSYGLIFGTYPAVIADKFGTRTFSTTWGLICTGPLATLYFLNKYFGLIYDRNTDLGSGICFRGNECYKGAFELSFSLCFIILLMNLLLIYVQRRRE